MLKISNIHKTISLFASIATLGFGLLLHMGCSNDEETELEKFEVIHEESGDDSGDSARGTVSACVIAPRFGTLAIVRYHSYEDVKGDEELICTDAWPYRRPAYDTAEVEVVAHIAGPELPEGRFVAKGGFQPGMHAEAGDLRLTLVWDLDEYILHGAGIKLTTDVDSVSPPDPGSGTSYSFARTVDGLRSEVQAVMASPLPEKCPGFHGTVPDIDEAFARDYVYLQDGEQPDICSAEPEQTQPDPDREGFGE